MQYIEPILDYWLSFLSFVHSEYIYHKVLCSSSNDIDTLFLQSLKSLGGQPNEHLLVYIKTDFHKIFVGTPSESVEQKNYESQHVTLNLTMEKYLSNETGFVDTIDYAEVEHESTIAVDIKNIQEIRLIPAYVAFDMTAEAYDSAFATEPRESQLNNHE